MYLAGMAHQQVPEGTPLSQREWDRLSEASRRWVLEALAAVKEGPSWEGQLGEAESDACTPESERPAPDSSDGRRRKET